MMLQRSAFTAKRSLQQAEGPEDLFLVDSVVRATGGVSPCFLYRGQRAEADRQLPAVKRRNLRVPVQRQQPDEEGEDQLVPDISSSGAAAADAADNQQTLYISYEPSSPSPKLRWSTPAGPKPVAPYRVCLRDASDNLLFSYRGLPAQILTDKQLCTARWGPLCIRFPSSQHLAQFAGCMRGVAVSPCCDAAAAASVCAASAAATPQASHVEAGPQALPPPPPAWALRRAAAASALQAQAKEEEEQALQQQEGAADGADSCPCTPRAPSWALPSALRGVEPLHLATPPPLNRCALSGDGCAGAARVPALLAPLPTPVPFFGLPTPVGRHPPDAVAAAIAMLEAGVTAAQAW